MWVKSFCSASSTALLRSSGQLLSKKKVLAKFACVAVPLVDVVKLPHDSKTPAVAVPHEITTPIP